MIIENTENLVKLYIDDPLDFLVLNRFDTKIAKEKIRELKKVCNEIENEIERHEKANCKTDLYSKYVRGELPHIHCSSDPFNNVFSDALNIQGRRIEENLKKAFPNLTKQQIKNACFRGDINKENAE